MLFGGSPALLCSREEAGEADRRLKLVDGGGLESLLLAASGEEDGGGTRFRTERRFLFGNDWEGSALLVDGEGREKAFMASS